MTSVSIKGDSSIVKATRRLANWMNFFSGAVVYVMMIATVADIVLRFFGRPLNGTYEVVSMMGAIVIGYAIPKTTLDKGHIFIDVFFNEASNATKIVLFVATRILGIALFLALACFLCVKGYSLYKANEVSQVLQIPHYPVVYALIFCCLVECFALIADIAEGFNKGGEA